MNATNLDEKKQHFLNATKFAVKEWTWTREEKMGGKTTKGKNDKRRVSTVAEKERRRTHAERWSQNEREISIKGRYQNLYR
jgi:hypothetical protein